jgi:RNA polymerase sigma-70 factor (ECF subfamily)
MDDLWIERARRGDAAAFNALMQHWHPRICRYVRRYFARYAAAGEDVPLAAEVAQKTFISAYEGLGRLRRNDGFRAWLYRIAINHCHAEERRRKPDPLPEAEGGFQLPAWDAGPEGGLTRDDLQHWLQEALRRIPAEQREVVLLKEYEHLTFREIAEALQIPESTAKSRLYYGLRALRELLEGWRLTPEHLYHES